MSIGTIYIPTERYYSTKPLKAIHKTDKMVIP